MNLELLPNEILLDLFDYFNGIDLIRTFYGLNSRFNFLLYNQFRSYYFQFQSVSKRNFDMICQQHLPFIADRVITLRLSDYRETPEQINLFFSYIPSLRLFSQLRFLALSNLHSYHILLKILNECQHLCNLTHLDFYSCSFSNSSADLQLIIDKIWSLPKLTNCFFDINIKEKQPFCVPTIISSSLSSISISQHELKWNQINELFKYTPLLKSLFIYLDDLINDDYIPTPLPTLIRLNVCFAYPFDISKVSVWFQNMPNLRHLDINAWSQLINGHQWEQIIRNYLPKLKTFQLEMEKSIREDEEDIQAVADHLLNSFRSSFWIDEHQWFVRCITLKNIIYLYTLSNGYNYREGTIPEYWESTYPHDNQQEYYGDTTSIYNKTFFNRPISSNISLPNIKYLYMQLPINDEFWSIVPNLNQLKMLSVSSHADNLQSQLQALLDQAPHLYILGIHQDASLSLQMSLFKYINASVRELDLQDCNHYFNEEECTALTNSPLGVQCEVLFIRVNDGESIINLTKNMFNLRALVIKFADDEYYKQPILTNDNDELVQWLKDHLPSTYVIARDLQDKSRVLIWM